jgi:competence protein ComEA
MKKWLDTYFDFTKREFNGLMTLAALTLLVIVLPYAYALMKPAEPITEAEQLAILKLSLAEKKNLAAAGGYKRRAGYITKKKAVLFVFDPNTIGQADWEKLGLSARQAGAILKYRARGGKFRKTEDLKKMYTINEQMYGKLAPYVRIVKEEGSVHGDKSTQDAKARYVKRELSVIEINGADTTELDKIKGVGMTFANRIVKYRVRIGGFYKKEQLMEVFGLDSAKYLEIKDQVIIDAAKLKKINVNTAGFEDFRNHPYIRYKQVNALIQYRKQHGNYSNIADLNKVIILDQQTINRLAPYLEF